MAQENENDEQATVTRSISLPRAIWPLMDAAAAKENRSRSQWLQVLLRQHFGLPPLTQPVHRNGRA